MSGFAITTLTENSVAVAGKGLKAEHGLSFYIQTPQTTLLFDTGQTDTCVTNAAKLAVDLKTVQTVVLSHGHYDHTGGLGALLDIHPHLTLIAHPDAFGEKRARGAFIGAPLSADQLKQKGVSLRLESGPVDIGPDIQTTGEIRMTTDFEAIEPVFSAGKNKTDPFRDDQALILNTSEGIVVVFGCAHRGAINTLKQVRALTGAERIHAIMGGLHLLNAGPEKLERIIAWFRHFDIQWMGVGHCTGQWATGALKAAFGERVFPIGVGAVARF